MKRSCFQDTVTSYKLWVRIEKPNTDLEVERLPKQIHGVLNVVLLTQYPPVGVAGQQVNFEGPLFDTLEVPDLHLVFKVKDVCQGLKENVGASDEEIFDRFPKWILFWWYGRDVDVSV